MEKKIVSGTMLTLLLIGMLIFASDIQPVKASRTIYIRSDGSVDPDSAPIWSIDNVTYNFADNIYDMIGVQRSNIIIDGNGYTLQGSGSGSGFGLSSTYNVTIKRTKIRGFDVGIGLLKESFYNTISENNITNNEYGIWLGYSSYNTISGNTLVNNWQGIGFGLFEGSIRNTISGNNIANNDYGIMLTRASPYNSIVGNSIANNGVGIALAAESHYNTISGNIITQNNQYGIWLDWNSGYNTISGNNIANNKYGIWLFEGSARNTISGNSIANNGYGIALDANSGENTISGNIITQNNQYGIWLWWCCNYNSIVGNSIANNGVGIWVDVFSSSNTISGNSIANNGLGIGFFGSDYNSIYHNNFVNNGEQVTSFYSTNVWDDGYPSGGNYWRDYSIRYPTVVDDYHGENQDIPSGDGIWDSPYFIDAGNKDNYPFVNSWFLDMMPPVADAGLDQIVHEDTPVTLNGEASSDNVGIVSYVWTFTDVTPQTLTGVNPTYTFQTPGIYTVTLNVTDSAGNWDTDTVIITVLDVTSPVADAGSDQTVNEDTEVAFDGSGSSDNVDIVSFVWNFGDGTTGTGVTATHTYTEPGTYTVTLNVTDARGNWDTDDVVVTVLDVTSPVADAGPDQTVDEDTLVTLEGWRSTDNVGVTSWTWTFTDVTPQTLTGVNPTYTFTTPGIYTVTLEVSDAAGNHATDTVIITVLKSLTPEELIQRLMETIESWNLGRGTENSLTSKLEDTLHLLDIGNENGAIHKLMDFINQVEASRGMKLTIEQADYLTAEAQRIIELIKG